MVEKAPVKNLEGVTILGKEIKIQTDLFLQNPQAFQEPKRKTRQINLGPQALSQFNDLPINLAQMTDVQMLVVVTSPENTQLSMLRNGEEVDKFKHTDPPTTFVYFNFKDRHKPGITFIFTLKLGDGQPSGAFITQLNPNIDDQDTKKHSYRGNVASDLTAVRGILRKLNKPSEQTSE